MMYLYMITIHILLLFPYPGEHLCLNYHLDELLLFHDLTALDVSRCGLGDDHEILANIANLQRYVYYTI